MQPPNSLVFFDQFDDELNKLKERIHEDFYNNHLINIFQALGQYEFRDNRQIIPQNVEAAQYLTLNSIQKHFARVFGSQHNVFAEMFYSYLSDNIP